MTTSPTSRTADSRTILRRIWTGWVRRYLGRLLLAFALMAVVAASASAYPLLTRYIFNALADGRAAEVIVMAPVAIVILALVKGVALFAQTVQVNALALRVTTDLQKDMARTLIEADLAVLSREPVGAFMSRIMNDLNLVREAAVRLANNLVRDVLTVIVLVGAMIWLDWLMALVVLAVYPLAMQPIIRIGARQRKASGNLQEHMEGVTSLLAETLQGTRMVKAYQLEDTEIGRTRHAFDGLYTRLVGLLTGRAKIDPILEVVGGLAVGGVVALAGWRVSNGQLQVGDVIAFITTLILLVQPVRGIGTLNAVTQEALAAAGLAAVAQSQCEEFTLPLKIRPPEMPLRRTHFREPGQPGEQIGGAAQQFFQVLRRLGGHLGAEPAGGHIEEIAVVHLDHIHRPGGVVEQRQRFSATLTADSGLGFELIADCGATGITVQVALRVFQ